MKDAVYHIIEDLRRHPSILNKQAILEANKDNETLRMVFDMTENPSYNYYIKVDPKEWVGVESGSFELDTTGLQSVLDTLHGRLMTGNEARKFLSESLSQLTTKSRDVLIRVINRDLDCKTGTSICNKVWPKLIPEMPCMLASKMDEKAAARIEYKEGGYIVQTKMDGGRAMATVGRNGGVEFLSRNGKPIMMHGVFDNLLEKFPGYVFDGELVVMSQTGVEDRQTGNGYFTKAVRGTIPYEEAVQFHYVVWDMIPYDDFFSGYCKTPYSKRLQMLLKACENIPAHRISVVEGKMVDSLSQAQKFYENMLERGEEGAIIKFLDMPWEDKRSKFMIKMKEEKDIDALVVGVTEHTKKKGWIGALTCQTSDGLVQFDVGSGFTEDDRQKDPSYYMGKIVTCKYNAIISNKSSGAKSLFLPVFVTIRDDKTVANSLDELK